MKTFYIFKLNKNYTNIAKSTPENIYLLFCSIKNHKKQDLIVAYDLLKEICLPINKDFFNEYIYMKLKSNELYTKFKNVHMYNDYLNDEISKMNINNSHIKIKSNKKDNIFITNLFDIDNLFICDFENNYYKHIINKKSNLVLK